MELIYIAGAFVLGAIFHKAAAAGWVWLKAKWSENAPKL